MLKRLAGALNPLRYTTALTSPPVVAVNTEILNARKPDTPEQAVEVIEGAMAAMRGGNVDVSTGNALEDAGKTLEEQRGIIGKVGKQITQHGQDIAGSAHKRAAFTLIELLVTVAIIAGLVAIILPSLRPARKISQTVADRATLSNVYKDVVGEVQLSRGNYSAHDIAPNGSNLSWGDFLIDGARDGVNDPDGNPVHYPAHSNYNNLGEKFASRYERLPFSNGGPVSYGDNLGGSGVYGGQTSSMAMFFQAPRKPSQFDPFFPQYEFPEEFGFIVEPQLQAGVVDQNKIPLPFLTFLETFRPGQINPQNPEDDFQARVIPVAARDSVEGGLTDPFDLTDGFPHAAGILPFPAANLRSYPDGTPNGFFMYIASDGAGAGIRRSGRSREAEIHDEKLPFDTLTTQGRRGTIIGDPTSDARQRHDFEQQLLESTSHGALVTTHLNGLIARAMQEVHPEVEAEQNFRGRIERERSQRPSDSPTRT